MEQDCTLLREEHPSRLRTFFERAWRLIWNFSKKYWYLILCAMIPALIVGIIYAAKGHYPLGNGSVLVLDLNGQYVWFFEALRNFVKGDANLLYSFSRSMGGEFLGIYAYYLASPFSYLLALFPKERMLEALLALFMLKSALCGWSFGYYMHRTMKDRNPIAIFIFSLGYSLSSYALVLQHNIMWMDAMIWLPLITLGIEALIKEGKFRLYTILLALTVFSNFYIGFMVCIYCALYFFAYYFAHDPKPRNPFCEAHHFLKSLGRIAFYSLLAIGAAAVILLAAYYSLNFGKTTFSNPDWSWSTNFDLLEFFYKFLPGSYDTVRPEGLPFVYCGILTLLFVPVFFFSKQFSPRAKIAAASLILVMLFSLWFNVPDLIWHGFQKPNWLNYRYSFILCFILCALACRAFGDFKSLPLKPLLGASGAILLLALILIKAGDGKYFDPNPITCILFTAVAVLIYLIILGFSKRFSGKQVFTSLLVSVVCIEMILNGVWNIGALDDDIGYAAYSDYNGYLNGVRPIVESVQTSDPSFYRMEKSSSTKINDNMALNIRGITGSTSTLNTETLAFLSKMGYHSRVHTSRYLNGNPVSDSLLGIRYVISEQPRYADYYAEYLQDAQNGYSAYYNRYALSLAYGVDDAVLEFPLGFAKNEPLPDSPEEDQKTPAPALISDLKNTVNGWLGIEETVTSATYVDLYHSPFERLNRIVTAMLGEKETVRLFVPIDHKNPSLSQNLSEQTVAPHYEYIKSNAKESATLTYTLQVPEDAELFFYMPSEKPREVLLSLAKNGTEYTVGSFAGKESNGIVSLGKHTAGDIVQITVRLKEDRVCPLIGENYFYYLNRAVFEDSMSRLSQDQYKITAYTESSFSGTFTASRERELVMTTIPYDNGWKITVDGREIQPIKALGSVVAFYIDGEAGQTHTVDLVYSPNTLWIGLTVSLISIGLLSALILLRKKLMGVKILGSLVSIPDLRPQESETKTHQPKRRKRRK